jgi:hypothetical protein
MAEIIELLFEYVDTLRLVPVIKKICSESALETYQIAGNKDQEGSGAEFNDRIVDEILTLSNGVLYLNFSMFKYRDFTQDSVGMSVYMYNEAYDLSLDFNEKRIRKKDIEDMLEWIRLLDKDLNAKDFFCGYESANDFSTRFFSKTMIGPLKW